ncbi:MAG: ATP-binding protein, partial [Gammaproteobacteria bacterium]
PGAELGREPIEHRVPAAVRPQLREAVELAISTRAASTFDYTVPAGGGTRRVEVTVAPLALVGAAPRACVTLTDVAGDHGARAALERATRAAHMAQLTRVTSGIAHDLNNVLTGVHGYARLATRALAGGQAAQVPRYLEEISTAARRAGELLTRMLTFSRGALATRAPVDLAAHVAASLAALRARGTPGLTLTLADAPAAGHVEANPGHLDEMLAELVANAHDALDGTGHVALDVSRRTGTTVQCDACHRDAHGDWLVLSVSDGGPGIAPAVRAHLFEPYVTTRDSRPGAGLGLAVVHGLVHQYDGHVRVVAAPAGGTTFELYLPAGTVAAGATDAPHVLLVAAEATAAARLVALLADGGCVVTTVADDVAALAHLAAAERRCDVLLVSDVPPGGDVLALARRGCALRAGLRTVLLGGPGVPMPDAAMRAAGIVTVPDTPLDAARLLRVVADQERAA